MNFLKILETLTICFAMAVAGCTPNEMGTKKESSSSNPDSTEDETPGDTTNQTDSTDENMPPVARGASYSVLKNSSSNELTLLWSDGDTADVAEACAVATQPANGSLGSCSCSQGVCRISYTPAGSFLGDDSFTFTVNDGEADSPPALISLNVYEPHSIRLSNGGYVTTHPFAITGTSRSFAAWVRKPSSSTTSFQSILLQLTTLSSGAGFVASGIDWKFNDTGKIKVHVGNGVDDTAVSDPYVITDDIWTHVIGVITPTKLKMYVNGVLEITNDHSVAMMQTETYVTMGRYHNIYYTGFYDDPMIFDYELSAENAAALAANNKQSADYPNDPVWAITCDKGELVCEDESGNGNHATVLSQASTLDRFDNIPNVLIGTSLQFKGRMSLMSDDTFAITGDRTFSVWLNNSGNYSYSGVIQQSTTACASSASRDLVGIDFNFSPPHNHVKVVAGDGTSWDILASAVPIAINQWTHLAAVVKADQTMELYINGSLDAAKSGSVAPFTSAAHICVGKTGAEILKGFVKDARVYSRALAPSEISTLASGGEPSDTGLELRWKMHGTSGDAVVIDSSSNSRRGTITDHGSPTAEFSTSEVPAALQ